MALISEWMQQCEKKVLDDAGIVRDACFRQQTDKLTAYHDARCFTALKFDPKFFGG